MLAIRRFFHNWEGRVLELRKAVLEEDLSMRVAERHFLEPELETEMHAVLHINPTVAELERIDRRLVELDQED